MMARTIVVAIDTNKALLKYFHIVNPQIGATMVFQEQELLVPQVEG